MLPTKTVMSAAIASSSQDMDNSICIFRPVSFIGSLGFGPANLCSWHLKLIWKWLFISFIIFLEAAPEFSAVGCYKENKGSKKLLKKKYASFAGQRNAADPEATIMQCAFLARDMKLEYFALQNYGECWTDDTLGKAYETYTNADESSCKDGIGGVLTNFVYHLK